MFRFKYSRRNVTLASKRDSFIPYIETKYLTINIWGWLNKKVIHYMNSGNHPEPRILCLIYKTVLEKRSRVLYKRQLLVKRLFLRGVDVRLVFEIRNFKPISVISK